MAHDYDSSKILYLTPREHVRMRPGMYFGWIDSRATHRLLWDIVDNSTNQVVKGLADNIIVTLHDAHTISIEDNGEGIPTAIYEDEGKTLLELVLVRDGGGYVRDGQFYRGTRTGDLAKTNAVSSKMDVVVKRDGFVWEANYEIGLPTNSVRITRPMQDGEATGTKITFSPDFDIFEKNDFQQISIMERLKELSFLLPKTTFIFIDPHGTQTTFLSQNGLVDYIDTLNKSKTTLHPPIGVSMSTEIPSQYENREPDPIHIEVAFQYVDDRDSFILSYVTTLETDSGGNHVNEFIDGLSRWIRAEMKVKNNQQKLSRLDIKSGLVAVVYLVHPNPQFESQIKTRFINKLGGTMRKAVLNELKKYGESHPDVIETIIAKCLANHHYHRARKTGE